MHLCSKDFYTLVSACCYGVSVSRQIVEIVEEFSLVLFQLNTPKFFSCLVPSRSGRESNTECVCSRKCLLICSKFRSEFFRSTSPTTSKTSAEQKDAKASSRDRDEGTSQPSPRWE